MALSDRRSSLIPVPISALPRNVGSADLASQALDSPIKLGRSSPAPSSSSGLSPSSSNHHRPEHYAKLGLTRLPVSVVSQGRALSNGSSSPHQAQLLPGGHSSSYRSVSSSPPPSTRSPQLPSSPLLNAAPSSPNRTNQSSKVILDLQQALDATREKLVSSQAELRASQAQVVGLSSDYERLKERSERGKLETEGLNQVVARKERLLQETLERARTAEADAKTLRDAQKEEAKSLSTLQTSLTSTTLCLSQSQAAYSTLSSSFSTLKTQWSSDLAAVKADYTRLLQQSSSLKAQKLDEKVDVWEARKEEGRRLRGEREAVGREWEGVVKAEMGGLKERVERLMGEEGEEGEEGLLRKRVEEALGELTNLRRMIKKGSGGPSAAAGSPPISPSPSPSPSLAGKASTSSSSQE